MKKIKLTDIAPYSGRRVQPFSGAKRYMSTGDLKEDNLSFENVSYETKPSRADILVSEGDILFAKMTNTNKALQIDKELDGIIVSTGFSVHRPLENELFGEYFLHFLKHYSFQRQKNKLCTGAIQSAISNSGIEKIFVPVPDYKDQLHIANLLSKAENLIAQRKESIRLLDEFLKSTFLEMFGDPVRNEKGWEKDKVISYTDCIVPGRDKPKSFTGNTPWFTTEDLNHKGYVTNSKKGLGLSDAEIKEVRARVIPAGSVLITCVGDLGVISICKEDCVVNQQLHAFICKDEINNLFLMYSLSFQTNFMYKKATSTTVPYMNKTTCNSIPVIVPPIELQTQFANIVEKTENLKTQYQESLQELENLYGSLSQKAFRGELCLKDSLLMAAEPKTFYVAQSNIPDNKRGFAKQVLGGKIVSLFKDGNNFTHIKFQKLQYLAEQIAEENLLWNYYRQTAGPHDNKFKYSVIAKLNENKWFEERNYKFYPLQKASDVDRYYQNFFGNKSDRLNEFFLLLKNATEKFCEAIATIYAVWNNHIILQLPYNKSNIKKDFFEWSNRKEIIFTEDEFEKALEWMKKHNIEPIGFGQLIKEGTAKK